MNEELLAKRAVVQTPFFPEVFSRKRLFQILRALHFVVCLQNHMVIEYGKLSQFLTFWLTIIAKILCQVRTSALIKLSFYGREDLFKQYLLKKSNRFRIKHFSFPIVKYATFFVYTGSDNGASDVVRKLGNSGVVVHSLLSPSYLMKGTFSL